MLTTTQAKKEAKSIEKWIRAHYLNCLTIDGIPFWERLSYLRTLILKNQIENEHRKTKH